MPIDLKSSETLKNLMRAFAGESQARNRYTFAAGLCRQQKLHLLEQVFLFTANQEKEHAEIFYNHVSSLSGMTISIDGSYPVNHSNRVIDLLRSAQHNEFEEFDPVYPSFAAVAAEEGFPDIARSFQQIASIEQTHGKRFALLADLLEKERLFVSDVKCGWMCLNCGHIQESLVAPELCPVCSHDQGYFIRLEMLPTADLLQNLH